MITNSIFRASEEHQENYPDIEVDMYYFWNMAGLLEGGPYETFQEAETALTWHCAWAL